MTKIVKVNSVLDIDFEALGHQGISHVMSDIESTLCAYGRPEVDPDIKNHLQAAIDLGHIASFSLVTNKAHPAFLSKITAQFPGTGIYSPTLKSDRKPSPSLLLEAMKANNASPDEALMVGDKLTADIRAAQRAGVALGFWVKKFGSSDHIGDRIVRRPWESVRRPFTR